MALRPTAISYKDTEEDKILREWVHSHSNYSGFIKDILRKIMNEENKPIKKEIKKMIDLDDF